MTKEMIQRLNEDCTNIETVYNDLLKQYDPEQEYRSELTFINQFDFDNLNTDDDKTAVLSRYLSKRASKAQWKNIDYFNRYMERKEFNIGIGFTYLANRGRINYPDSKKMFKQIMERYNFIFDRLNEDSKEEFKYDFLDQLQKAKEDVQETKYKSLIDELIQGIKKPQQKTTVKAKKVQQEFKDFFKSDIESDIITKIQEIGQKYSGKDMAYLIYLLDVEFGFITYTLKGRKNSRSHLIKVLNSDIQRTSGIDKYFTTYTKDIGEPQFEKDPRFITIKETIEKTIE